ncbi:MAG: helix-turn-helix domain-containing protein [Actinobacteria bacterium]|nr:helix-turn-helix domain-containing protein [Actinomycetota bacterium]
MNDRTYDTAAGRLGDQLRRRRRALHLTQEEVAELAGTTQRTVSVLESGKPTARLDVLVAVAEALGLQLVALPHDVVGRLRVDDETPS